MRPTRYGSRPRERSDSFFWVGVPLLIATALWWPRTVVLYTGGGALEFNRPRSPLPTGLADLVYSYRASLVGVALLLATVRLRSLRSSPPSTLSLPACYLPTYIAGIESTVQ